MSLMVIEKSSGNVIACHNDREKSIWQAQKCGVAKEDMVFVTGDVDNRIYKTAKGIVEDIKYLPRFLFDHGKSRNAVDAAQKSLDVWQQVVESRVVDHPEKYSSSLADIFGSQLAAEIMVTIDAIYHPDCVVYAPATWKKMEEAKREGRVRSSRTRRHLFMMVRHNQLGVCIVGPSTMFTCYQGFKIDKIFVKEKR